VSPAEQRLQRLVELARKASPPPAGPEPDMPPFLAGRVVARWQSGFQSNIRLRSWDRLAAIGAGLAVGLAMTVQLSFGDRVRPAGADPETDPFTEMAERPFPGVSP
jgi:hypothetical protein